MTFIDCKRNYYIELFSRSAARKVGSLSRDRNIFSQEATLNVHKYIIRSCIFILLTYVVQSLLLISSFLTKSKERSVILSFLTWFFAARCVFLSLFIGLRAHYVEISIPVRPPNLSNVDTSQYLQVFYFFFYLMDNCSKQLSKSRVLFRFGLLNSFMHKCHCESNEFHFSPLIGLIRKTSITKLF